MKKVISIILMLVMVFTLSGCFPEQEEQYCNEEVCYTKDEVRELIDSLVESSEYKIYVDMDEEFDYINDEFDRVEQLIIDQANIKERTYDIIEVEVVSVNGNVYLVETLNLINSDQYILVSYNQIFVVGDKTHIASYYDGDIRLWNELKEFED